MAASELKKRLSRTGEWRQQTIRFIFTHLFCEQSFFSGFPFSSHVCECVGELDASAQNVFVFVLVVSVVSFFFFTFFSVSFGSNAKIVFGIHTERLSWSGDSHSWAAPHLNVDMCDAQWRQPELYPLHFMCMHISFKLYFLLVRVCMLVVASSLRRRCRCWCAVFDACFFISSLVAFDLCFIVIVMFIIRFTHSWIYAYGYAFFFSCDVLLLITRGQTTPTKMHTTFFFLFSIFGRIIQMHFLFHFVFLTCLGFPKYVRYLMALTILSFTCNNTMNP